MAGHLEDRYPKAAACLRKDQDFLLRYFDFPKAHWVHLKTTNPIESIFAGVRLRTRVIRRFRRSRTGVPFASRIFERLSSFWQGFKKRELVKKLLLSNKKKLR